MREPPHARPRTRLQLLALALAMLIGGTAGATCADTNGDGTQSVFDCSLHSNYLHPTPGSVQCAAAECSSFECCTVPRRTCASFDCSSHATPRFEPAQAIECAEDPCLAEECCTAPTMDGVLADPIAGSCSSSSPCAPGFRCDHEAEGSYVARPVLDATGTELGLASVEVELEYLEERPFSEMLLGYGRGAVEDQVCDCPSGIVASLDPQKVHHIKRLCPDTMAACERHDHGNLGADLTESGDVEGGCMDLLRDALNRGLTTQPPPCSEFLFANECGNHCTWDPNGRVCTSSCTPWHTSHDCTQQNLLTTSLGDPWGCTWDDSTDTCVARDLDDSGAMATDVLSCLVANGYMQVEISEEILGSRRFGLCGPAPCRKPAKARRYNAYQLNLQLSGQAASAQWSEVRVFGEPDHPLQLPPAFQEGSWPDSGDCVDDPLGTLADLGLDCTMGFAYLNGAGTVTHELLQAHCAVEYAACEAAGVPIDDIHTAHECTTDECKSLRICADSLGCLPKRNMESEFPRAADCMVECRFDMSQLVQPWEQGTELASQLTGTLFSDHCPRTCRTCGDGTPLVGIAELTGYEAAYEEGTCAFQVVDYTTGGSSAVDMTGDGVCDERSCACDVGTDTVDCAAGNIGSCATESCPICDEQTGECSSGTSIAECLRAAGMTPSPPPAEMQRCSARAHSWPQPCTLNPQWQPDYQTELPDLVTAESRADSYITIGMSQGSVSSAGIDWKSWTETSGLSTEIGSLIWKSTTPSAAGESMVAAQLTLPARIGAWSGRFNLEARDASGNVWIARDIAFGWPTSRADTGVCLPCSTPECGCTDPNSPDFTPDALYDDGTCTYHTLCGAGPSPSWEMASCADVSANGVRFEPSISSAQGMCMDVRLWQAYDSLSDKQFEDRTYVWEDTCATTSSGRRLQGDVHCPDEDDVCDCDSGCGGQVCSCDQALECCSEGAGDGGSGGDSCQSEQSACTADLDCTAALDADDGGSACQANDLCAAYTTCMQAAQGDTDSNDVHCPDEDDVCDCDSGCGGQVCSCDQALECCSEGAGDGGSGGDSCQSEQSACTADLDCTAALDADDGGSACQANDLCAAYTTCMQAAQGDTDSNDVHCPDEDDVCDCDSGCGGQVCSCDQALECCSEGAGDGGSGGDSCQSEQSACTADSECNALRTAEVLDEMACADNFLCLSVMDCLDDEGDEGGEDMLGQLRQSCPDELSACEAEPQCMNDLAAAGDSSSENNELRILWDCMRLEHGFGGEEPCPFTLEQAREKCEVEVFACDIAPSCMDAAIAQIGSLEFQELKRCMINVEARASGATYVVCPGENEESDSTFSTAVEVQVTLSATMEQVEADRNAFEASFKSSVATELSVDASAVTITNITAGSVVVSFTVTDVQVPLDTVESVLGGAALAGFAVTAVQAATQGFDAGLAEKLFRSGVSRHIDCSCELTADGTGCKSRGAQDSWFGGHVCQWYPDSDPPNDDLNFPTRGVDMSTGCKPDNSQWQCHSMGWTECADSSCGGDVEPGWSQPVEAVATIQESCTPDCTGETCEATSCELEPGTDCSVFGSDTDHDGAPDERQCSLHQIHVSEASNADGDVFIELHNTGAECSLHLFTLASSRVSPRWATDSTGSTSRTAYQHPQDYVSDTAYGLDSIADGYEAVGLCPDGEWFDPREYREGYPCGSHEQQLQSAEHDSVFMFDKHARIPTRGFWLGFQNNPHVVGDHDDSFSFPLSGTGSAVYLCEPCSAGCAEPTDKNSEYEIIGGEIVGGEIVGGFRSGCKKVDLGPSVEGASHCFDADGASCSCSPTPGAPNSGAPDPSGCSGITTTVDGEYSWSAQLTLHVDHSTLAQDFEAAFRRDAKAAVEAEAAQCGFGITSLGVDVEIPRHIRAVRSGSSAGETVVDFAVHSKLQACTAWSRACAGLDGPSTAGFETNPICMDMVTNAFFAAGVPIAGTTTTSPVTQLSPRSRTSTATGCTYQPTIPTQYSMDEAIMGQTRAFARESHVFRHVKVSGQNAGTGGALAVDVGSHVSISRAVYEGNSANFGGAIYIGPEDVVADVLETSNLQHNGNFVEESFITGKQTGSQTPRSTVSIMSAKFLNNKVDKPPDADSNPAPASVDGELTCPTSNGRTSSNTAGLGGAIYVCHSNLQVQHTEFSGNRNTAFGDLCPRHEGPGSFEYGEQPPATVNAVYITENQTKVAYQSEFSDGGAIYAVDSALTISASSFSGNAVGTTSGTDYADTYPGYSDVLAVSRPDRFQQPRRTSIGQNWANGGAIHLCRRSSLSMQHTMLSGNIADGLGGAIYVFGGSSASIRTSSFVRNDAHRGGALYMADATVTIESSSFTGNQADVGGAIFAESVNAWDAARTYPVRYHYGNSQLNVTSSVFKYNLAGGHVTRFTFLYSPEIGASTEVTKDEHTDFTPGAGAAISVHGDTVESSGGTYDALTRSHVSVHISSSSFVDNSAPISSEAGAADSYQAPAEADAGGGGAIRAVRTPLSIVSSAFAGNTQSIATSRRIRIRKIRETNKHIAAQQIEAKADRYAKGAAVFTDGIDNWRSMCDHAFDPSTAGSCDSPFKIYNTTFEPFVPESLKTVTLGIIADCTKFACQLGEACSYTNYSLLCKPCTGSTVGRDGLMCISCVAGESPNDDHTECEPCTGVQHSTAGICIDCPAGKVPLPSKTGCEACAPGMVVKDGRCVCEEGRYNSSRGLLFCFQDHQDYHPDVIQSAEYNTMRVEYEARQECLTCPECVVCHAGEAPLIEAGYSLSPAGLEIWGSDIDADSSAFYDESGFRGGGGLDVGQVPRSLFFCAVNGQACDTNSTEKRAGNRRFLMQSENGQCRQGHTGALCGSCTAGYSGAFGELCTACLTSSWALPLAMLGFMVVLIACLYRRIEAKAQSMQLRLDSVRAKYVLARRAVQQARSIQNEPQEEADDDVSDEGAFQATLDTVKVIIGNLQIITQFPVTLKFSCPACKRFRELVSSLSVINIDVLGSFKIDCLESVNIGLYTKFVFVVVSPVIILALLWAWTRIAGAAVSVQQAEKSSGPGADTRLDKARNAAFLLIFLMYVFRPTISPSSLSSQAKQPVNPSDWGRYPTISTTVFSVFACREMDFEHSWHTYDADIDCNSGGYYILWTSAVVALVLIPLGVPCLFAFLLYKNRVALSATAPSNFSFDVFATTVRSLLNHQESFSDEDLRAIYDEIDADNSGQVSPEELWMFALEHAVRGRELLADSLQPSAEEVRASEELKEAPAEQVSQRKWWKGGRDEFSFLVRAYEAQFFWFELTQYGKKFILSGVLVFAQPGSTAQLYIACIVSFFFFAVLTRTMPFKNPKTDRAATVAEANLFFTILCLLMMKINLTGEFLGRDFYDFAIAASNVLAAALPVLMASILAIHRLATEWVDSRSDPLNSGDIVRVIVCPDNLQCCGRLGKVVESDGTKFEVEVRIRTATSPSRYSSCRRSPVKVHKETLVRDQVQVFLNKKQTLKLAMGLFKQLFICAKAARNQQAHDGEKQKKGVDGKDGGGHHVNDTLRMVVTEVHVIDGLHGDGDEEINMKEIALDSLRSAITPALAKRNLHWEHIEPVIKAAASLSQLQSAIADPEAFITDMSAVLTPLIIRATIAKLRPKLEPVLKKQGLAWETALPALELIDTVEEVEVAVADPEAFLRALMAASGPAARALMIAKAKPVIQPLLLKHSNLPWGEVKTVLGMTDLNQIELMINDPECFVETMLATVVGPVAKKLALARLKPKILPVAQRHGLAWEDVAPALALVDTIAELEAAVEDPDAFFLKLLAATGPAAKAMLLAQLRPMMEPMVIKKGLAWADALPIIDLISTIEHVRAALDDPECFVETMLATVVGPVAKKLALARLKPKILPVAQRHGLAWEDVAPALALVDTIAELEAAVEDPDAFFLKLLAATGPAAKAMLLAQLRPMMEPMVIKKGLAWADALPIIDLISTIEHVRAALDDPECFVETMLATVVGPVAKKLALARLKPKILPVAQRHGLAWEDVAPALALVDSVEDLTRALDDPEALLKTLVNSAGPAAKRMAIARLRPQLEPLLASKAEGIEWIDAASVMDMISTVQQLQHAADDPEGFVDKMLEAVIGPAAKRLAVGKMKARILPAAQRNGFEWEDVAPALELVDTVSELQAAMDDPEAFLVRLMSAAGPVAKRMAIAKLRPQLEPMLSKQQGLAWEDTVPVIDMISTTEDLQAAIGDPNTFAQKLLAASGPAAKRLAIAKLRPVLEPPVLRQGLAWEDVAPALELVDTVSELHAAMDDPEAFLVRLMSVAGPVAKRMAIAKLRPQLEPMLAEEWSTHSDSNVARAPLLWSEAVDVIDLVAKTSDDMKSAIDDPELFVQLIVSATGPAAKRLLIGRLRLVLEPTLMKLQGTPWAQVLPALERIDDSTLEAGLRDPEALVRVLVA